MFSPRPVLLAFMAGLVLIVVGVSGVFSSTETARATSGVSTINFAFAPQILNVPVGEAVRWINDEKTVPHTVTSEAPGGFNSPTMKAGDSYFYTFAEAGSFQYYCIIHPGMRAVVNVGNTTGTPSARPAARNTGPISVRLSGANEVPAVTTTGNGSFVATPGTGSLAFQLQAFSVGLTASHIHLGAAGTNGPVVAFLFGPNAVGQIGIDVTGTITEANLVGPLAGKYADFAKALAAGNLYVNVHSLAYPGGEIRVQIPGATAPAPPKTGSGTSSNSFSTNNPMLMAAVLFSIAVLAGTAGKFALKPAKRQ